jgi:hypothetical protein
MSERDCKHGQQSRVCEICELGRDAKRYRWIVGQGKYHADFPAHLKIIPFPGVVRWENLDEAIDCALTFNEAPG